MEQFEIHRYDLATNTYFYDNIIERNEIISYTFTQNDYPSSDTLSMEVKNFEKFLDYVPTSEGQFHRTTPLIILKRNQNKILWFSFITSIEKIRTVDEDYISFGGRGFTWFHEYKLLNANTNFSDTGEPADLPEDFGFYKATTTLNKHLKYALDMYINPRVMTFGRLSTTPAPYRKFKALRKIDVNFDNDKVHTMRIEQADLRKVIDYMYEVSGVELVTKQRFVDGQIEITVDSPHFVNTNLLRKERDLLEDVQQQTMNYNMVFGYGFGNADYTAVRDLLPYHTTLEHEDDLQYLGKANVTYISQISNTFLSRYQRQLVKNLLKIHTDKLFTVLEAGDIVRIRSTNYQIKSIQESNSIDGINYDISVEEIYEEVE